MGKMKPYGLKRMPFAVTRDNGEGIAFRFLIHSGKTFDFACPPEAVPEIVARLLGAAEETAQKANPAPLYRSNPAEVVRSQVGLSADREHVTVVLYPAPHCGIGFALTPEDAQRVSSEMAAAASMIAPKDPTSLS